MRPRYLWVLPLALLVTAAPAAQIQLPVDTTRGPRAVVANTLTDLQTWDTTINRLVRNRDLVALGSIPDPDIAGRSHETLAQYYQGIPVYGATVSRQIAGGTAVSIIGTLFEGIDADVTPSVSASQAVASLFAVSGGRTAADTPTLVIFPLPGGTYRLAWRVTMNDAKTYIVDADTSAVIWTIDEMKTQGQVGTATGALGDRKKISTTLAGSIFRAHDQLRPAPIRTFDTRGSNLTLDRLLIPPGTSADADFAIDSDNTWTDTAVVDTHVHSGWVQDYLFKQFNWTGIDNQPNPITAAVHSGLVNNAYFIGPPFGPGGRGAFVYGRTTTGLPMTTLDIVAHETMHGVTNAALVGRTGAGLLDVAILERLGPTAVDVNGTSLPCNEASVVVNGQQLPIYCANDRYVLVSNHPGALNEAFADVLGIGSEFFFHAAGTGTLRGDYKMGEDLVGFGPNRAADTPASIVAMNSARGLVPYPDHASRKFDFLAAVAQGTRTNPLALTIVPATLSGNTVVQLSSSDGGGVHVNATIMSHAFYLAVEGGRNATSGMTVQGVGAANRTQIERAFFRAMTVLMPNIPTMPVAAQATVQAAIDLYGAGSAPATSLRQAMQAVGLMN